MWSTLGGAPFVTVSARGLSNGLASTPNDGSDFGPDTYGTATSGLQEALNAIASSGGMVYCKKGTYNVSSPIAATGSNQTVWFEPNSTIVFASTTTPWSTPNANTKMLIQIASNNGTGASSLANYSHVYWIGNGTTVNANAAGITVSTFVFGIVQAGFLTTASPPAAGEDIVLEGFIITNIPNASVGVFVENFQAPIGYANQLRSVVVRAIHATWSPNVTGGSGIVVNGSTRGVLLEDCYIDASAVPNGVDLSNCFIRCNAGDCTDTVVRRCVFKQNGLSGQVLELQGNSSAINPAQTRNTHRLLLEDCTFDSGAGSVVYGGAGGGYIDDNNSTGASGFIYDLEFKRCTFLNCGINFQSSGSQFGYLRFDDESIPGGFIGALAGRGPADPGVAIGVGGSPFTYTNSDGTDEEVVVQGGAVTSIKRNGTLLGVTQGLVKLRESDTVTVAYTAAPTMTKQAL